MLFPFFSFVFAPAKSEGIKKVVIDAGHGGMDPGNLGTGRYKTREKDIALDVSLQLGKYIEEKMPDVEVVYTRKSDKYPELWERTAMANKENADLYISIHCDAFTKESVSGCSSFVMGMANKDKNMRVAKKENSVIFMEDNYSEKYAGFDPNNIDSYIALSLYQNSYQEQSLSFASKVQDQFRDRVSRRDRGVKQQPLWVTSRVTMPSVLIELGFLTNKKEEDFLNSKKGKDYMASAIYRAFRDYKKEQDGLIQTVSEAQAIVDDEVKESEVEDTPETFLTVQLLSSKEKLGGLEGFDDLIEFREGKYFKYASGKHTSVDQARKTQKEAREKGYKDAFIIGIRNGVKISVQEALEILK